MVDQVTRDPAFVQSAAPAGGTTDVEVDPITSRKELNELNPVIRQTREAQEAFNLPSHVVPSPEQMQHVSKFVRQERENEIVEQNKTLQEAKALEELGARPEDIALDDSMIATGAEEAAAAAKGPAGTIPGGASIKNLEAAFKMRKEGKADELAQQAVTDKMTEANAILRDELQADVDAQHLDKLEAIKGERDKAASDITEVSKQFIKSKIDPNRWYASRTTGQKIGLAVGAFLTGFGGTDSVLKMIDNAISRDIDAQKADMSKSGGTVKNMMTMVSKIYGDNVDAEKYARGIYLSNIENQLKINLAKAKSGDAASKMKTAISGIQIEKEKLFESIATGRSKLASDLRKENKLTDTRARALVTLGSARSAFNEAFRALDNGNWTKRPIGDNKFTAASREFVTKYLFFLSGANVPESEKGEVKSWLAQMSDTRSIQKWKMTRMRNILNREMGVLKSTTIEEASAVVGGSSRNKFFKPSK